MSTSTSNPAPIAPDDAFEDEGYAESTNTSYLTSLASDIRRGVRENGRIYASYGKNVQGIPIDAQEQDRNDLQHAKFMLLLGGKLHLAPIDEDPQKILDLGAGSGIWSIDMADRYPSAQVTGVDIAPTQPTWVPPNCQFEIEDVEQDWMFKRNSFDFIFGRELQLAIHDWPKLIKQAYDHLRPGGYLELSLTNPKTCCPDGSLDLSTSAYAEASRLLFEMARKMGVPIEASEQWKEQFTATGFEDVEEHILPIPINAWPKDKQLKRVGIFEFANIDQGLDSFLLRGFTTVLGRPEPELRVLTALARQELRNRKHHVVVLFRIVYGRKPRNQWVVDSTHGYRDFHKRLHFLGAGRVEIVILSPPQYFGDAAKTSILTLLEGQGWEETSNGADGPLPSRQPDGPIPASTIQLLESGLILDRQSPEAVPNHYSGTQSAGQIVSLTEEVACTESGLCVSIQDITFLRIEGQREAACEPEYLCVGQLWLRPDVGLPWDLLQVYRREVARRDRLATLRTRKRTSEEVDLVKAARCSARKNAKRARC